VITRRTPAPPRPPHCRFWRSCWVPAPWCIRARPRERRRRSAWSPTAIDRAADRLAQQIAANLKVFLDTSSLDGPDARYAAAEITDRLLRRGLRLMATRAEADAVVIVRSSVLSTTTARR